MFRIFIAFLAFVLPLPASEPAPSKPIDEKVIDAVIQKALKDFDAPGVAVAVVRDEKVVYLKGAGVRQLGGDAPVTPDTLFAIASCSKAFTATAVAMLVDEGKAQWDDPVRKHLPSFRLSDPLADRDVTLRDLLCHRTGLARHDWLRKRAPWGPEETIRRLAHLKPSTSFRSTYEYNNLAFLSAGHALATLDKRPFADCLRQRLFEPLGMRGVMMSGADAEKAADRAAPHLKNVYGKVAVIPRYLQLADGAGGINASARDLTGWLRFQLSPGVIDGKRLVAESALKETHTPQIVIRREGQMATSHPDGVATQVSYGLGWFIHDHHGHEVHSHGGSIDGFRARCVLVPRARTGFVVLTNLGGWSLPEAVSNNLLDLLLGAPPRDWNAHFLAAGRRQEAQDADKKSKRQATRRTGTKPSLELAAYTGSYQDPAYGEARVLLEGNSLRLHWSSLKLPLEHFHFDTFSAEDRGVRLESEVVFRLGADGKVAGMGFLGQDFWKAAAPGLPKRVE